MKDTLSHRRRNIPAFARAAGGASGIAPGCKTIHIKKSFKKILVFAREAGGVSAVAPVCRIIKKKGWKLIVISKDHGIEYFQRFGFTCVDVKNIDDRTISEISKKHFESVPDVIFTSAASLPTLDMSERYLWKWGQGKGIPTIGIVDQWQNYALRFSGPTNDEWLAYMPDYIFVMDNFARDEMLKEGISPGNILVTGQPAFEAVINEAKRLTSAKTKIKERLNIPEDFTIITFVAESLKKDFLKSLGYDEQSTLLLLGEILEGIARENNCMKICLIVKLHPENKGEEFTWIFKRWPSLMKRIAGNETRPFDTIVIADTVVGMTSIMLVHAALCRKPVVSLELNSLVDSQFVLTKSKLIPYINTGGRAREVIRNLLNSAQYREEYLASQDRLEVIDNAANRCFQAIHKVVGNGSSCVYGS